ncbi:MAG: hypothetical protein Q7T81_07745 [Pseudolabrys sp.]|nr:hypothetical protein [Pseudolabrys sp.]
MKILGRIKQVIRERATFLQHDGVQLAAATTFVGAALFGIYNYTGQPPAPYIDEAAVAARFAESQREAALVRQARRAGTILFVSADKFCEEHHFDNATGHTVAIDYVDCEERLSRNADIKKEEAKTAGLKGMLAGFKK